MKIPNNSQNLNEFMTPPPAREDIEKEIHELLHNGDLSKIARYLQKDQAAVSKEFNPWEPDRVSIVYQFMLRLWAFDQIRDCLGDMVLTIVTRSRESWLGEDLQGCPAKLTRDIAHEFGEFLEAEIAGKSFDEQIRECLDIEVVAKRKRADLIARRNMKHFNVREYGRDAVAVRRNGRAK